MYDYMSEHQRKAWWGYIVSAPFKALGAVMSLISGDEEESEGLNPYHLTKDQEEVVKALQERVSVSVDKKTLVITASVYFRSDDKGRFGKPPELYYELSYAESKARFGIYPEGIWRVT